MIEVEFSTALFVGLGGITCHCGRRVWFPDDCSVVRVFFENRQIITDAATKAVVHDCARPLEFYCPDCMEVYEATAPTTRRPLRSRRLPRNPLLCPECFAPLEQRRVSPTA